MKGEHHELECSPTVGTGVPFSRWLDSRLRGLPVHGGGLRLDSIDRVDSEWRVATKAVATRLVYFHPRHTTAVTAANTAHDQERTRNFSRRRRGLLSRLKDQRAERKQTTKLSPMTGFHARVYQT